MVFISHDVSQQHITVAFLDQADGNARHRLQDRNTRIHEAERRPAHGSHAAGTVRLQDFRNHANGVRELFRSRHNRFQRPFRQGSMPNLSPTGTANRTHFPNAERRKVVIEHELFGVFLGQALNFLLIADGAERGGDQSLRLASSKQSRAVRAGQHTHFAGNRSQVLWSATIQTFPFQSQVAHHSLFQVKEGFLNLRFRPGGRLAITPPGEPAEIPARSAASALRLFPCVPASSESVWLPAFPDKNAPGTTRAAD
jgi:hypothetical protein